MSYVMIVNVILFEHFSLVSLRCRLTNRTGRHLNGRETIHTTSGRLTGETWNSVESVTDQTAEFHFLVVLQSRGTCWPP